MENFRTGDLAMEIFADVLTALMNTEGSAIHGKALVNINLQSSCSLMSVSQGIRIDSFPLIIFNKI